MQTAVQAFQQRNLQVVWTICQVVLKQLPYHPKALYLFAMCRFNQGDINGAQGTMEQAFSHGLSEPAAHLQYANIVGQQGQHSKAISHLKKAVELKPSFEAAWAMGVKLAAFAGEPAHQLFFAKGWNRCSPEKAETSLALSDALHHLGEDETALEVLKDGDSRFSAYPDFKLRQAGIFELQNKVDKANELVDLVLTKQSKLPAALILKSRLLRRTGKAEPALAILNSLQQEPLEIGLEIELYHEASHHCRLLGRYKEAWQNAEKAKACKKRIGSAKGSFEDIERSLSEIEKQCSDASWYGQVSPLSEVSRWLFLVGFPRVGSTLLEKLITLQYNCEDAGESQALMTLESSLGQRFKGPWWTFNANQWQELGKGNLESLLNDAYASSGTDCSDRSILDKQLFNLARLPLIGQLAPKTPVIRMVRHPLDVLVSCYFANFSNQDAWHMDIVVTARYLARLDEFWEVIQETLPNPVLILRYEEMVQSDTLAQPVTQFLDNHWQANRRGVDQGSRVFVTRTASYEQVQDVTNTKSVGNYINYLESLPEDCIEILKPVMARWGYSV
ncbi:sulfotransferase [Aliiglaciecola sp. CAU 1673]|uniref:tetratricopeptide repeat-containing sulfotransferase family protein n=1 Tax=Aliiglaciecola sp. CAU 1673 TaxID=3032595 RepID=UPI0023DB5CF4|nr:tetratricopeptide repeat-containing sulfotransferase family protein [Aliiglaciecola sp. CAU 1673]MDF2177044.1 sulfotransferase [Aliiglaciecola sp. CAU 1673]